MRAWRVALRIARREARRSKGRSALVLALIGLPVLAVSAAAVVIQTADVSGIEGADRQLGAADARIRTEGRGRVFQAPTPRAAVGAGRGARHRRTPDRGRGRALLPADARLLPITSGWSRARLDDRLIDFSTTGVDLTDPMADGLFELESGRLPSAPGEVVTNAAMLAKGLALGDTLDVDGTTLTLVGVGRDATIRDTPVLLGAPDDLPSPGDNVGEWLVEAGPVPWSTVLDLNALGAIVTSRSVLADPPDVASTAEQMATTPAATACSRWPP